MATIDNGEPADEAGDRDTAVDLDKGPDRSSTGTGKTKKGKAGRSGNPAKANAGGRGGGKGRTKRVDPFRDPSLGSPFTLRFALSVLLFALGVAWIVYYYTVVRPTDGFYGPGIPTGGPGFMGDLKGYNYAVGFGLVYVALILAAHPKTPLGRGRGVVSAMLGCFIFGLAWICVFYAIANNLTLPVFNDLGQKNLLVGVLFMAVGFTYATRWE